MPQYYFYLKDGKVAGTAASYSPDATINPVAGTILYEAIAPYNDGSVQQGWTYTVDEAGVYSFAAPVPPAEPAPTQAT